MNRVRLTGRPICADADEAALVRRHLPRHVELTGAEPGCLHFAVSPTADLNVWDVEELFVDQAAFDAHQARVRASTWGRETAEIARDYRVEVVASDG